MVDAKFSPKEFLKNRRPEKFSDSIILEKNILNRPVLEHCLANLNKHNQELAFEDYARQICQKIICPNLLAQTGPVAGGDGKVDTQTFPVSEQNKLLWYEGINDSSDKERWAFAMSTQETWQSKCRKDILKIKQTERGYVKAFFITNQYCKSNQRSDLEDKLKKETDIDVRILDISWLLDQTLKNGYENIAIEALSLTSVQVVEPKLGSNDYRKSNDLEELINKIDNEIDPKEILPHQVSMFLETAILSKELEKSVLETQGLFDRAVRVAEKFGTNQQQFSTYYEYAWASHWWFEDFSLFETNFEKAFDCIVNSTNSSKWEDLVTLINVFQGHVKVTGENTSIDFKSIEVKTRKQLKLIADDDARPSNSLQARTSLELLNLVDISSQSDAKLVFRNLLIIAKESEGLVGYSFDSLFDFVSEMDQVFGDIEEYEALLDYLTEQSSIRYGEAQSSLVLLKRGAKRLDSEKPYQAIKLVGRSLLGLYKQESRKEVVLALNLISSAYTKVGLLWAARGSLLLAASLITDEFWRSDEVNSAQVRAYFRLAWLESQLGRVSHALTWLQLAFLINHNLESSVIEEKEMMNFDGYLSHCLLRADRKHLECLEKLPDLLDDFGLFNSRAMLLYSLGYEQQIAEEIEVDLDDEFLEFLKLVRDYDFGVIAPSINTFTGRVGEISSCVLGCHVTVSFPLRSPFVELGESVLSVIEGFCSTGIVDSVYAAESNLRIDISADDEEDIAISHEIDDSQGNIIIDVMCSAFTPKMLNVGGQKEIQEWLHSFIIDVYFRIMVPKSVEDNIKSLLMDDKALERSISFGACFTTTHNVLGNNAIKDISTLLENHKGQRYKRIRSVAWDSDFPIERSSKVRSSTYKTGDSAPPDDLLNHEGMSHMDITTHGLIKTRLWDNAKWKGTAFILYPDELPGLSLMFEDEGAAISVFTNLFDELGSHDHSNRLRISIIRKISSKKPYHYRVSITENMRFDETKFVTMISRSNTMEPVTDKNLNNFISAYKKSNGFWFSCCIQKNGQMFTPANLKKLMIYKDELIIKDAWEVGRNDMECMGIKKGDTPIVPEHIEVPPVAEILRKLNDVTENN